MGRFRFEYANESVDVDFPYLPGRKERKKTAETRPESRVSCVCVCTLANPLNAKYFVVLRYPWPDHRAISVAVTALICATNGLPCLEKARDVSCKRQSQPVFDSRAAHGMGGLGTNVLEIVGTRLNRVGSSCKHSLYQRTA